MTEEPRPSDIIIKLKVKTQAGGTEILNAHHGVLCKSSRFFQRATKPEWTTSREQPDIIDLPDYSVETISNYIRWLYCDHVPIKVYNEVKAKRTKRAEEAEKAFVMLAEAYVFGEQILDVKYKNAVVQAVIATIERSHWNLGPKSVNIIYEATPSTSPLRRLFADSVASRAYDDSDGGIGWIDYIDGYPREALVDAMKATIKARSRPEHGLACRVF
ncbi:hypothetical protein DE146DRAFT_790732 [Phaeosphaeria sp. MPI-PUGE-AT-0046c]|nr:hypothetical protein DE146DRAFT_790732 [Phaeosphaeria sp. MPI-PUGE-AT-0046c]